MVKFKKMVKNFHYGDRIFSAGVMSEELKIPRTLGAAKYLGKSVVTLNQSHGGRFNRIFEASTLSPVGFVKKRMAYSLLQFLEGLQ